jgi:ribosome-interacting GTPase 1
MQPMTQYEQDKLKRDVMIRWAQAVNCAKDHLCEEQYNFGGKIQDNRQEVILKIKEYAGVYFEVLSALHDIDTTEIKPQNKDQTTLNF